MLSKRKPHGTVHKAGGACEMITEKYQTRCELLISFLVFCLHSQPATVSAISTGKVQKLKETFGNLKIETNQPFSTFARHRQPSNCCHTARYRLVMCHVLSLSFSCHILQPGGAPALHLTPSWRLFWGSPAVHQIALPTAGPPGMQDWDTKLESLHSLQGILIPLVRHPELVGHQRPEHILPIESRELVKRPVAVERCKFQHVHQTMTTHIYIHIHPYTSNTRF